MRCPKCSSGVPRSDKASCEECGYRFGLDPAERHGLTDADYLTLVDQASAGGRYYFTQNQLYLYYCIERMPHNVVWPFAGVVGGLLGQYFLGLQGAALGALTSAGLVSYGTRVWRPPPRSVLDELPEQMKAAGHPIKRLISKPLFEFREEESYTSHLPNSSEIERIVITDRNILVDLLVLNNFPKRARALVVSQTGYPNFVIPIAKEMLEKRKSLAVYLLHDSTESRLTMKRNLTDTEMLPLHGHQLFNLGIDPEQVYYMKQLTPLQPARSNYHIPFDSIPYSVIATTLNYSMSNTVPLLTAMVTTGFVSRKNQ